MKSPGRLPSCPRFSVYELLLSSLQPHWVDCILPVNASQHVCGVNYVDCSPANVFHKPRPAMIPTLELHFAFHRAFMNLYHEQKFGVKQMTKAQFFNLVRRIVGKRKKTCDSESKGRGLRAKGPKLLVVSFYLNHNILNAAIPVPL
ncbi:uncharacterized protein ARMOST_19962 [Armillaria ostoyae]|uniref:Uncharacterized protein n=1 Tax=Armillaria ostoyae TaxID=47428 RepID=A0A284S602_ARMOS|nr:uncharacterized protein ARMOST_19962 [Armillaria ostoyae]